jgi:hypothetical protein
MLCVDNALMSHQSPLQFPDFDQLDRLGPTAATFSHEMWFQLAPGHTPGNHDIFTLASGMTNSLGLGWTGWQVEITRLWVTTITLKQWYTPDVPTLRELLPDHVHTLW